MCLKASPGDICIKHLRIYRYWTMSLPQDDSSSKLICQFLGSSYLLCCPNAGYCSGVVAATSGKVTTQFAVQYRCLYPRQQRTVVHFRSQGCFI